LTSQTNPPEIRAQENETNAASMATRRTDPSYRTQENERNDASMVTSRTNPAYRQQEQIADTNQKNLQESNRFFMTWQLSLILQVAHTYIISLVGYGTKNVVMGVGTFICQVHQVPQKELLCKWCSVFC
jgi:hypothetical protein